MIIKNIIFDLDGTLIDSSDGVVEAVNYSLRQMNQPQQPPDVIKQYIGYPLSKMYPDFTDAPVKDLYRHFQMKAAESVVNSTVALPGAKDILHRLHGEGYHIGIGTTKVRRHIMGIVDRFGWQDLIIAFTGGDEVPRVKPDPAVFVETMARMKALPEETVVVGDTENDVIAARAVPVKVIGIRSPYGGDEKLRASGPDLIIDSLDGLFEALKRLMSEVA